MQLSLARLRSIPPLVPGTLESLKWLAVALMTADHINLQLLYSKYPIMFAMGRVSLPLFVFVLAYNLARPEAKANGAALRVLGRLLPVALISCLPYMELNLETFSWRPLNVLFTLAAGTAIVALIEQPTRRRLIAAVLLYAGSGALVDYGWTGVGLFVCCWHLFRGPSLFWAGCSLILLLLLGFLNHNQWALMVLPVLGLAFMCRLNVPRVRNALYYYYPLHLAAIVVLKIAIFGQ